MPIPSITSILYNALLSGGDGGYEIPSLPQISRGTFAGIVVAISGNVVISLALNCQKLAHRRLEEERTTKGDELQSRTTSGEFERSSAIAYGSRLLVDSAGEPCLQQRTVQLCRIWFCIEDHVTC